MISAYAELKFLAIKRWTTPCRILKAGGIGKFRAGFRDIILFIQSNYGTHKGIFLLV